MATIIKPLADRVLEASERIADRIEEAYNLFLANSSAFYAKSQDTGGGGGEQHNTPDGLDIEDDEMESPLNSITDGVLKDVFSKHVGPQTPWEHIDAFKTAINWSEPFVLGLICFDLSVICATFAVITKESFHARVVLLLAIALVVYSAEWINTYGRKNWESFATQDYFDKQGVFLGIMLCGPLMCCSFFILVSFIRESFRLLVKVKRMELEIKRKQNEKKEKDGPAKATANKNPKKKKSKKDD